MEAIQFSKNSEAGSLELLPALPSGFWGPSTWVTPHTAWAPESLAGSWIGSKTSRTQTSIIRGYQPHRWRLNLLRHGASPPHCPVSVFSLVVGYLRNLFRSFLIPSFSASSYSVPGTQQQTTEPLSVLEETPQTKEHLPSCCLSAS